VQRKEPNTPIGTFWAQPEKNQHSPALAGHKTKKTMKNPKNSPAAGIVEKKEINHGIGTKKTKRTASGHGKEIEKRCCLLQAY